MGDGAPPRPFETALAALALLSLGCAPGRYGPTAPGKVTSPRRDLKRLTVGERASILQRAQVWEDVDTSSLDHPRIGEAGRRLLARKLSQLSDRQIANIFAAARVDRRGETIRGRDGRQRAAIVGHRCLD